MALPTSQQPEWSGLQVNEAEMQDFAPHASEDHAQKIPYEGQSVDHFAQDKLSQKDGGTVPLNTAFKSTDSTLPEPVVQNPSFSDEKQTAGAPKGSKLKPKSSKARRRLWILLGAIALIVVIVVAVPCGVLLSRNNSTTADSGLDTSSMPPNNTISTNTTVPDTEPNVAMNGTKLAMFQPPANEGELWMYWQGVSGDIRMSRMYSNASWAPSVSMNISNAANGTTLAIAAHTWVGTGGKDRVLNHLVFETTDGYYADLVNDPYNSVSPDQWSDGGLLGLGKESPAPGPRVNAAWAMYSNGTGFLFHGGSNDGWWNEWAYVPETLTWQSFHFMFTDSSAYGGGTALQLSDQSILYVVSPKSQLVGWYRDLSDHNQFNWHRMSNGVGGIWPNSSVTVPPTYSDPREVYYQDSAGYINRARANATDQYSVWDGQTATNLQPIGGSAMHAEAFSDGANNITHFFFQTTDNANGITHYSSPNTTTFDFIENVPL